MSFEDMLKELQQEYLSSLPQKLQHVDTLIAENNGDSLREAFHKLKGTGRTYGLPEVSDLGELVESICLKNPAVALRAAQEARPILSDIYRARKGEITYDFSTDPRVLELRKLLQK